SKLTYKGDMQSFLDETIDLLNKQKDTVYFSIIKADFKQAMTNCRYLFGKYAFRKCLPEHLQPNARQQLINKALFTVWTILTCKYPTSYFSIFKETDFIYTFANALNNNRLYNDAFSNRTNDRSILAFATQTTEDLIKQYFSSQIITV
ncbi:MAG: hypothetical protein KA168_06695, partial [Chitinophagales bacterium]|nr:hypothetical protein [Chitinophagales bacterium]